VNKIAIILAGGNGQRMKSNLPKQFLLLNNTPVLLHTLHAFNSFSNHIEIVVVLPENQVAHWSDLCATHQLRIPHAVTEGGPTRFHSVKNGLNFCRTKFSEGVVAIHDGVRPFVSNQILSQGYKIANTKGSAIPVIPLRESLRKISGALSTAVPREKYCLVQTPQFFRLSEIYQAYQIAYSETFTDDAAVYETSGRQVSIIDGAIENIKITEPVDLAVAKALIDFFEKQ
jgi:2-C-methyl-D-erythritol 4-phosphate cytidylyltransferase